jgi:hypothetical protein
MTQDAILGYFYPWNELFAISGSQPRTMSWVILSRPYGTTRWHRKPRTDVLGYSQSSLRDSIGERSFHANLQAVRKCFAMDSALAVGLRWETAVFQQPVKPLAPRLRYRFWNRASLRSNSRSMVLSSSSLILSSLRKLTAVERSSARSSWVRLRS